MNKQDTNFINPMYWDVGAHIGFCKTITPTISEAVKQGMYTCQFFMGNPKSYSRQLISDKDIQSTKKILERFPMNVFTHYPYIASLCGSVASLAWSNDPEQDRKTLSMIKGLEYELSIVSNFNINRSGVVIHPGSYKDRGLGLDTIAKTINKINFADNSKLLLENCAGEGNKLYRNIPELKQIMDGVNESQKQFVGACIDTAHLWGQGDYDIRTCDDVDRLFYDFDNLVGLENFTLLHLNDSSVPFGAKKDRHACIGTGYIWGDNCKSLVYLLNKCKENNIPIVLETTPSDMITLAQIQPDF
jgi:deoxyribonuclease-4